MLVVDAVLPEGPASGIVKVGDVLVSVNSELISDFVSLEAALDEWDIMRSPSPDVVEFFKAGPGGVPTQTAFSQSARWPSLDGDRATGCIRDLEHAFSREGGLAVLYGNIALDGCVVKTAGVDDSILVFEGKAHVVESQDQAVADVLDGKVKEGDVVVIRYEGPKGGPGMREMLSPTSAIMGKGLGSDVALITDGRFSGGSHGFVVGHITPEAAEGGPIALVEDGDTITIDAVSNRIELDVSDQELERRRQAWQAPPPRFTRGTLAKYSRTVSSASKGAVTDLP